MPGVQPVMASMVKPQMHVSCPTPRPGTQHVYGATSRQKGRHFILNCGLSAFVDRSLQAWSQEAQPLPQMFAVGLVLPHYMHMHAYILFCLSSWSFVCLSSMESHFQVSQPPIPTGPLGRLQFTWSSGIWAMNDFSTLEKVGARGTDQGELQCYCVLAAVQLSSPAKNG